MFTAHDLILYYYFKRNANSSLPMGWIFKAVWVTLICKSMDRNEMIEKKQKTGSKLKYL